MSGRFALQSTHDRLLTTGKRARQDPKRNKGSRPHEHDNDGQSTTGVLRKVSGGDSSHHRTAIGNDSDFADIAFGEKLVLLEENGKEVLGPVTEEVEASHQTD